MTKRKYGHVCNSCYPIKGQQTSTNQRITDWCQICGHRGEGIRRWMQLGRWLTWSVIEIPNKVEEIKKPVVKPEKMKNLENVNPGDLVTVISRGEPTSIRKVRRVTKTRIITFCNNSECAWRKKDGGRVGDTAIYGKEYIQLYSHEDREYIRRKNLIYKLCGLCKLDQFEKLTTEQLSAIYEIISNSHQSSETPRE